MIIAGADARPVVPDISSGTAWLAGFARGRAATAIADPPMVRSVALASAGGGKPWVLTAVDCIGLPRTPGPHGRHLVAATHTHHAPDTIGLWGPEEDASGVDPTFLAAIRQAVAESAESAVARLRPARLRVGATHVPSLVANHRDPHIVDDEMTVLQAVDDAGKAIATLVSYPCHPEVVDPESHDVTADYPGHLCALLEQRYGGTAVFVSGDLGGMQSPATEVRTHDEARRFGAVLADAVAECISDADDATLRFARATVPVELTNPMYRAVIAGGVVAPVEWSGDSVLTEVSLTRIGPVALAGVPGELLPTLGLALRERLRAAGARFPAIIGLCDDELGYILAEEEFVEPLDWSDPGRQYEESMSPGPRTGPDLMAAIDALTPVVMA